MTQQIALPLGLSAGPAEAGARVIRRALDQIGQAAGATGTMVQGLARSLDGIGGAMRADRAVAELKRVETGAHSAGVAAKAAFEGVTGTDLGRRLSAYTRELLRDQTTLRDAVRGTGRAAGEIGRGAGGALAGGFAQGKAAALDFEREARGIARRLTEQFAIRAVIRPMLGPALGGQAGNLLQVLLGGATKGGLAFDPIPLIFGVGKGDGRSEGSTDAPLSFMKNLLPSAAQWLAETIPSLFSTAGAAGALAPNLLATAVPAIAAIALPLLLSGLFSKKPTVGPNANATVGALASGALGVVGSGADNGGSVQAAIDLAESAIKALTKTLRQIGASLGDADLLRGLQVGYFKGKFFVDDTNLGGTARYDQNQFEKAEDAVADFVRRALNRADLGGVSPVMRTALANTKASSFDELGRHIDFARAYERGFEPLDGAAGRIEALTTRFDDLRDTAEQLGLDIGAVTAAFQRERRKLAEDMDAETARAVVASSITGFRQLTETAIKRLADARTLGADVAAVERQNFYEKRAFLLQLGEEEREILIGLLGIAEQAELAVAESLGKMGEASAKLQGALTGAIAATRNAAGSYRQLAESLRDTAGAIRLSDLGLLSTADKFAEIRRQFDEAKSGAASGDQDAARRLSGLARSTLEMGRQLYAAGPEYAALYQEVMSSLGDAAAVQDGVALRLDMHTVLLDAQLQVLREIDRRLAKSQEATGVLDYLDMSLTRQGTLGEFDRVVAASEIARLRDLAAALPEAAKASALTGLAGLESRVADGALSAGEADLNKSEINRLRLVFFEELQRQIGPDSDAVRAFDLLKAAIDASAGSSASLADRLRALGAVFADLDGLFAGAQGPLLDPAAMQGLLGNLTALIGGVGGMVPGDASAVIAEIGALVQALPALAGEATHLDLGAVSAGLTSLGGALEALGSATASTNLPGDLQEQEDAFRSLGGYFAAAGLAPSIDALVGGLDSLADGRGGGALAPLRAALAGLTQPTADLVTAIGGFDTAIARLLATLSQGTGVGGRRMPEIDRAPLSGAPLGQFDALAGRVDNFMTQGGAAGFSQDELRGSASWGWAVTERDRIIAALSTVGDIEALLDRYYGGQRQVVADASDQGANNLVRRLGQIQGQTAAPPREPLEPLVRGFLQQFTTREPEGEYVYPQPDEIAARNNVEMLRARLPWADRYFAWWNAGADIRRLDAFAQGGVVQSPTLFGHGGGRLGLMGEAGAEAILPLRRGRDGRLGVAANSNQTEPGWMADLVQEVRALRAEVADLRRQQAGEHRDAMGQGVLLSQRLGRNRAAGGRG